MLSRTPPNGVLWFHFLLADVFRVPESYAMTMKNAVMIGSPWALDLAYPPKLRESLGRRIRLYPVGIEAPQWRAHREVLAEAHVVLSSWGMAALDAELLASMPRLEAVFHAAGSVKSFTSDEAVRRGVAICSATAANAIPVAEFALGSILLGLKGFWGFQRSMGNSGNPQAGVSVPGIYGSTVGLVSLGAIGRRVAELLSRHSVRLLVHDPFVVSAELAALKAEAVPLGDLFERSDVVSLHTPWLPETEKMVGASLLRSMKRGATLVNTSRGAIVDEVALCDVLRERPDLTAVLDVTHPEPPTADSPLRSLPNVILTPHIAGSMGPEIARMGQWMSAELIRHLRSRPLKHQINHSTLSRMA